MDVSLNFATPGGSGIVRFVLERIVSGVSDYREEEQLETLWKPAVRETVLCAMGGSKGFLFGIPHGAVDLGEQGGRAVPRSSIEIRALVVFEE